jgi:hypothetical protein
MPSFVPPPVPDLSAAPSDPPRARPAVSELPDFAKAPATERTDVDIRLTRREPPVEPTPPFVDISFEDPEADDEESVTVPHARVQFDRVAQKPPDESAPRPAFPRRAPTPLPEPPRSSAVPAPAAFVPREDRDPYMSRMPTEVVTRPSSRGAFVWLGIAVLVAIAIGAAIAVVWSGVLDGGTATIEPEVVEPQRPIEPSPPAVVPSMEVARANVTAPEREATAPEPGSTAPATSEATEPPEPVEQPGPAQERPPGPEVELPRAPASYARLSARTRSLRAERFRTQARREHAHSRYQRAHDAWIEALRYVPNDAVSSQGVARSLARLDRMDEAIAWARRGVDLAPNDPRARELLGELYEDNGRLEDAREQYRAGLAAAGRDARLAHRVRRVEGALRRRR